MPNIELDEMPQLLNTESEGPMQALQSHGECVAGSAKVKPNPYIKHLEAASTVSQEV